MSLPNGWSPEQVSWLKPEFAKILTQNPLLPSLDFVSDRNLLGALRQQLAVIDAAIVIPDEIEKTQLKMPNGLMANVFQRRDDTKGELRGAVLIVHGGGFVAGCPGIMTQTAIALCQDTNLVSIVLPYRLAPEAPFPAGVQDVYDGFHYVVDEARSLSIDINKLALYGQSAGSDLAILAYLAYVQSSANVPRFKALILSSPVLPSADKETDEIKCNRSVDWCWNTMSHKSALAAYHGAGTDRFPHVHNSQVSSKDLALLPPTHVHIGEIDFLAQEALQLSCRLMQAGVPLSVEVRKGDVHIGLDVFIDTEAGKASRAKVAEHLQTHVQMNEKVELKEHSHPTGSIPQYPIDVDASTVNDTARA